MIHRMAGFTLLLSMGCATSFTGSAHIKGGRSGCERRCAQDGLEMSAFVYMGEYSDACVCGKPGRQGHVAESAAVEGAAASVVMQMRQAQREQQQGI